MYNESFPCFIFALTLFGNNMTYSASLFPSCIYLNGFVLLRRWEKRLEKKAFIERAYDALGW